MALEIDGLGDTRMATGLKDALLVRNQGPGRRQRGPEDRLCLARSSRTA